VGDMASGEYKDLECCIEERPDGFYVVRGDKAIGPYDTLLLPETERRKIAEELSVTEEEVKKALLSYVPSKEPEPDVIDIRLDEVRAELHGKKVRVKARIVGMSDPMAIPRFLKINCECGYGDVIDLLDERELITLRHYLFDRKKLGRRLCSCGRIGRLVEQENEMLDCTIIHGLDIAYERFGETRPLRIYLVGARLPRGVREAEFIGHVIRDRNNKLIILAREGRPLHEVRYEPTDEDKSLFKRYFQELKPEELLHVIDRSICPEIVGRPEAKLAAALTLHSPLAFYFEGKLIRGYITCLFLGDTTTGKTTIILWIFRNLGLGFFGRGDLTSEVGLTGAIDPESNIIIWGLLVLADGQITFIDRCVSTVS